MKNPSKLNSAPVYTPLQRLAGPVLLCAASASGLYHVLQTFLFYVFDLSNPLYKQTDRLLIGITAACALVYVISALMWKTTGGEIMKQKIKKFFCSEQVLLLVLGVIYVLSMCSMDKIYQGDWIGANRGGLLDAEISFLVLFPLGRLLVKDDHRAYRKAVMGVVHVLLLGLAALMGWVTVQIFKGNSVSVPKGLIYMKNGSRLVLNSNPNTGGMYFAVLLLIAVCMAFWVKQLWLRILYGASILIFYVILTLTNSRTCYVSVMAALMAISAACVCVYVRGSAAKRALLSIAAAISLALILLAVRECVFSLYNVFIQKTNVETGAGSAAVTSAARDIEIDRGGMIARFKYWRLSLKVMVQDVRTFFLGVSHSGSKPFLTDANNGSYIFYSHNQFIEMGLCFGVPGLAAFTAWMVLIARDSFRIQFPWNAQTTICAKIVPALVLAMVLNNLAEAMLMYYTFFSGSVFILFCGMTVGEAEGIRMRPIKQIWKEIVHGA